jgi:hypothetical protein
MTPGLSDADLVRVWLACRDRAVPWEYFLTALAVWQLERKPL